MDHVDSRAAFGCVDQLQRYSASAVEFNSAVQHPPIVPVDFNAPGSCGPMMISQNTVSNGNCDPLVSMHDFSASCNMPLGLTPYGSGDLTSMLALSSGLPAASSFAQSSVNPSTSMYPYLPPGGMQSFLQAATPAQFPFQNFPAIRNSFSSSLNPSAARAFSCFRPVPVGDQNLLLSHAESAQSHVNSYSQSSSMPFVDGSESHHADSARQQSSSVATRLLANSGLTVDQTVLNISTFFSLPASVSSTASLGSAEQASQTVQSSRSTNDLSADSGASVASSSTLDKCSPNSRRKRSGAPARVSQLNDISAATTSHDKTAAAHTLTPLTNSSHCTTVSSDSFVFNVEAHYNAHKTLLQGNEFDGVIDGMEDIKVEMLTLPDSAPEESDQSVSGDVNIDDSQCVVVDGVRRWRCLECPKFYSTKHNLVTHTLGHRGIKPHRCSTCGKYFKQVY